MSSGHDNPDRVQRLATAAASHLRSEVEPLMLEHKGRVPLSVLSLEGRSAYVVRELADYVSWMKRQVRLDLPETITRFDQLYISRNSQTLTFGLGNGGMLLGIGLPKEFQRTEEPHGTMP